MKIRPNPANLRIEDRSVVARDSSWPDCQLSWKDVGSRCRCAYRSSPDRLLHRGDRAGLDPAADQVQQRLGRAEANGRQRERDQQPLVAVRDRSVDDGLGEQRDRDLRGDRADRRGQHDDHLETERPQIAAQPPQRPRWPYPGGGARDQQRGDRGHQR